VNFDGRNTLNFGLGARFITDDETIITGVNAFFDHELDSNHQRMGAGVELLTSLLEFRANAYRAVSGEITYNGISEQALDGHDIKLTANLPYFYSSNVYYSQSEFKDDGSYKTRNEEWGAQAEVLPNLTLGVAQQNIKDGDSHTVASVNYAVPSRRRAQI
jgi:hypothetical protein